LLDLIDWLETPLTVLSPLAGHPLLVESYVRDGCYVVRAEIPGVDPEKDIEVTVSKGILTLKANKRDDTEGKHRSEFHYGTLVRSVTLPAGADDKRIQAVYYNGVLEVLVGLEHKEAEEEKSQRTIPVILNKHIDPS
jgi:HSP20 family protein